MKRIFSRIVLIAGVCCGVINAVSEFRTPLSVRRGFHHYPLNHVGDSWWYDQTCDLLKTKEGHLYCPVDDRGSRKDSPWYFDTFKAGYYRGASEAFLCKKECKNETSSSSSNASCEDDCSTNCPFTPQLAVNMCDDCPSTKRGSLATLWFGKETFKGEQAFAGGMLDSATMPSGNPFLSFSNITPKFDYNEWGIMFGGSVERRMGKDNRWRIGARMTLPFKVIEIEHNMDCDGIEDGLSGVVAKCAFNVDADATGNGIDYAYRLDFLSSLVRPGLPTSQNAPLVEYGTGAGPNQTKIAGTPVGFDAINATNPPVFLVKSADGSIPDKTLVPNTANPEKFAFGKVANGPTILPANGAGADGNVFYFDATKNYLAALGADRATQGTLFVVPRIDTANPDGTGDPTQLNANAVAIYNAIEEILNTMSLTGNDSAAAFFKNCCIDLCRHERTVGVGDLDFEMYGGYGSNDNRWFANGVLGFRFPTGKDQGDARCLYKLSTGHNGHFEMKGGVEGGWKACRWFAFYGDASYSHVFDHKRKVAAPFKGATIRNIGPNVEADVSWGYFTLHADANFFHPRNQDLGCVVGYEFFAKRKDNVKLCAKTAQDCLGNANELDACLLEACTDTRSHKIRVETFHRWNFGELFAGMSHVVGGRNVMRETEVHLGLAVYF